ncbi:MAG TPA: S24 family peptidase [Sphingomonas sp.]|nr:S24 family peptidase [Sphingomonas sp.]
MEIRDPRAVLAALAAERGEDYAGLSRLIGRNPAYVQQFIARGTPRRLAERDRALLARYFGVPEQWLGAPPAAAASRPALASVPRLDVRASAGPGAHAEDRASAAGVGFSAGWLRRLRPGGSGGEGLSMIRVAGDSMLPTLADGDEILVDHSDAADRLREGIYVLRLEGALLVKRLAREDDGFAVLSDNPAHGPVDISDPARLEIVGRVLWVGRKL